MMSNSARLVIKAIGFILNLLIINHIVTLQIISLIKYCVSTTVLYRIKHKAFKHTIDRMHYNYSNKLEKIKATIKHYGAIYIIKILISYFASSLNQIRQS